MTNSSDEKYWFYAKEYGYGWGLPACWQGWAVFAGYIAIIVGGVLSGLPDKSLLAFGAFVSVWTLALIVICWIKGEPLAWRWGNTSNPARKSDPRAYLVIHAFFGPLILGLGILFYAQPPSSMNHTYGYRTTASFQSQDAWDEAQRFSAKVMIAAALATIAYQAISTRIMKPQVALLTSAVITVLAVIAVVPITEAHLKSHLDRHGQKFVQPASAR